MLLSSWWTLGFRGARFPQNCISHLSVGRQSRETAVAKGEVRPRISVFPARSFPWLSPRGRIFSPSKSNIRVFMEVALTFLALDLLLLIICLGAVFLLGKRMLDRKKDPAPKEAPKLAGGHWKLNGQPTLMGYIEAAKTKTLDSFQKTKQADR
jgi:hypothetical protein